MGFWDRILGSRRGIDVYTPNVTYVGEGGLSALLSDPASMTVAQMWATQPHFRTVVEFVARNIAQLGLHVFERVDETDRRRDRTSDLARILQRPDVNTTSFEMKFALVGDLLMHDRAYFTLLNTMTGPVLRRIPPAWVTTVMKNPWEVSHYDVHMGDTTQRFAPEKMFVFTGYGPGDAAGCSPIVNALKNTLQEQVEAARYRSQVWKRGGRVSSVLERPKDSPKWSDEARNAFREDWYAKFTGKGKGAGGTPILEDGMTLKRIDFNAQEQQFVEAAKLSLTTVAAAFHVNPTMIGQNEGANYSNVREFRKMLYGDTLGPTIARIEARVNEFLIPMLGMDPAVSYAEFNIEEKLQGNFEEQVAALQSSVGGPYMTRNEARAIRNLPALPDGDGLIVPLNVLVGGQASPRDSGSQNRNARTVDAQKAPLEVSQDGEGVRRVKAAGREEDEAAARLVLERFFKRQRDVVLSRLGAKSPDWWDEARWDTELAEDLFALAVNVSQQIGEETLTELGYSPTDYDVDRTLAFLKAVTKARAEMLNATTLAQLEASLDDDFEDDALKSTPEGVFEEALGSRSERAAVTFATTLAGFAAVEAVRHVRGGDSRVTKTWLTTSGNPRPAHAAMDGETVPLDDPYSNGMMWPGDISGSGGDAEQIANCSCISEITIP